MGRGRAKAKQTKVARDLKYRTHEKELHGDEHASDSDAVDDHDEWSDYAEKSSRD
jgi:hypothetical protein